MKRPSAELELEDEAEHLILQGRRLLLSRAVPQRELKQWSWRELLTRRTLEDRKLTTKDKRNLYLLDEGWLEEENRGGCSDQGWRRGGGRM